MEIKKAIERVKIAATETESLDVCQLTLITKFGSVEGKFIDERLIFNKKSIASIDSLIGHFNISALKKQDDLLMLKECKIHRDGKSENLPFLFIDYESIFAFFFH